MDFDGSLDKIQGIDGANLDLGGGEPTYPDFPRDEYQRRYARLQVLMETEGLDALLLTQEENVRYLTGYNSVIWAVGRWLPGLFLATRDPADAVLMPSAFDVGAATGTSWVAQVDGHEDPSELPGKVTDHLSRLGIDGGSIGIERGPGSVMMLPWPVAEQLVTALAGARDASGVMSALRMLKSDREVARIRRIVEATTSGYRAALESAKPGMTERELVSIIGSTMHANGATAGTRPLFLNCVSGPDRYPLVDTVASDRELQDGDVVFVDGGGGGDGYMSDIIRLLGVGEVADLKVRYADLAQAATEATLEMIGPGVTATEVFRAGLDVYTDAGFAEQAGGLSGHGIGMEIWERPFVRDHGDDVDEDIHLRPGMTMCIEPILLPLTDDGALEGIFVLEQQILVTEDGCEVLSGDLDPSLWRTG